MSVDLSILETRLIRLAQNAEWIRTVAEIGQGISSPEMLPQSFSEIRDYFEVEHRRAAETLATVKYHIIRGEPARCGKFVCGSYCELALKAHAVGFENLRLFLSGFDRGLWERSNPNEWLGSWTEIAQVISREMDGFDENEVRAQIACELRGIADHRFDGDDRDAAHLSPVGPLTTAEWEGLFGVTDRTLREWIKNGSLVECQQSSKSRRFFDASSKKMTDEIVKKVEEKGRNRKG